MERDVPMHRTLLLAAATTASALPLAACSDFGGGGPRYGYRGDRGYDLSDNDVIYRDHDGRYYCKRRDGTRGAIVGGLAGGVLGNVIAPNGSKTLGTIIGAAGGALAGQQIDKRNVRCE